MIGFKQKILIALLAVTGVLVVLLSNIRLSDSSIPVATESSNIKLLNAELLEQNGKQVKFVTDIVGDRIVVINFIYTDCTTACPISSAILSKLQDQLGEKLQQNVHMISISINPSKDTPESLKTYAAHFNAKPEWVWLTGEKNQVDDLLKGLRVYSVDYRNHTPVILVGDPVSGIWVRFDGFTSPEILAAKVNELLAARHEKS